MEKPAGGRGGPALKRGPRGGSTPRGNPPKKSFRLQGGPRVFLWPRRVGPPDTFLSAIFRRGAGLRPYGEGWAISGLAPGTSHGGGAGTPGGGGRAKSGGRFARATPGITAPTGARTAEGGPGGCPQAGQGTTQAAAGPWGNPQGSGGTGRGVAFAGNGHWGQVGCEALRGIAVCAARRWASMHRPARIYVS